MKRVFNASNPTDAYLIRDLLEQSGITAHVFNTHAMSAFGELPSGAAYPQVWITRDELEARARELVAAYLNRPLRTSEKGCPACGEKSPGEFDFCWACNAPLAIEP